MKNKILIISSSNDLTCDYIIKKFTDIDFFRFNVDLYYEYYITVKKGLTEIIHFQRNIIISRDISIYYRKPSFANLNGIIENRYINFCLSETYALIEGIIEMHDGLCLSKPSILRRANNKILQSKICEEVGFSIPDFCITNSEKSVIEFSLETCIVKPIHSGIISENDEKEYVQTNIFDNSYNFDGLPLSMCEHNYDFRFDINL
jgi:hypothetical protein